MDFRSILRDATRAEHDLLDARFTALDISERAGFSVFVHVHLTCFQMMADAAEEGSYAGGLLRQMAAALSDDRAVLGTAQPAPHSMLPATLDPLAIDYLVAGSRLGTKVLRKRWAASADPVMQRANAYFGLESDPAFWRSTCAALSSIAADSPRAKAITRDSKILFGLFLTVFERTEVQETVSI